MNTPRSAGVPQRAREDQLPDEWQQYIQINADSFKR